MFRVRLVKIRKFKIQENSKIENSLVTQAPSIQNFASTTGAPGSIQEWERTPSLCSSLAEEPYAGTQNLSLINYEEHSPICFY